MNDQAKNNLKAVALSLGIVLIVASVVIIIYKQYQKGKDDSTDDTNPYLSKSNQSQTSSQSSIPNYSNQGYTESEVEKMQGWLFSTATLKHNDIIVKAIRDTGGIDGKMGSGFKIALKEAMRVGYVKDLKDLEIKSKS